MRIGVDARHLAAGRGVAHYTRTLLGAAAAADPDVQWRCFVPGRGAVDAPAAPNVALVRDRRPSRAIHGAAATVGRPRLDRLLGGGLDAVWLPAPAPVALSAGVPYALTVHDLSWVERPADFTPYERLWHRLARPANLARGATRVLADSRATATVARDTWALDEARLRVVPPGVTSGAPGALPADLPTRFVLFVGALEPRKAPDVLARAYARARADGLDAGLVVVGDGRLADAVAAPLAGMPDVAVLSALDRAALDALYAHALAVVAPSRLEGFGFVPLEAGGHGTPSILSDLPVFAETMGDAAVRVPVDDEAALAAALRTLVDDGAERARLGGLARERAGAFGWPAAADGLLAALRETAGRA
jgi:glycosyltransferase involved in cell wall biosynthesis